MPQSEPVEITNQPRPIGATKEDIMQTEPIDRLLRLPAVLALIPMGKSMWHAGVAAGRLPQPVKLGKRCTCWRASDIAKLIAEGLPEEEGETL